MPATVHTSIRRLKLDLTNFRTVRQPDEIRAVQAMISISPDYFWALTESLIEDDYLPTDNIIGLSMAGKGAEIVVKEGNRRVAALKLIHGILPTDDLNIPENIERKIKGISLQWKKDNEEVPCAIYEASDAALVDRIVTLAHGKGEKAGRDQWKAVARARHNRDVNKASEPGLDLLEKYLEHGKNLTRSQAERWAGTFPLTVLDEAIKKISPRFGVKNAPDLAKQYPNVKHRKALEDILRDIGLENIRFETIRNKSIDFALKYGVPLLPETATDKGTKGQKTSSSTTSGGAGAGAEGDPKAQQGSGKPTKKPAAASITDPRSVTRALRGFVPRGNKREKVVALRDEAKQLNLKNNPMAFCFVLRSMFEISAMAYCDDHKKTGGPSTKKADGKDKKLSGLLADIAQHLIKNSSDKDATTKMLHGATSELSKPQGMLSVTSMNQLVHNPSFSVSEGDICRLFANVFPLLEAMNE
jgi:hypothetical protein